MEPGTSLINRTICTKQPRDGSSPGAVMAKALTFSRGFKRSPAVGRHSTPATAKPVRPWGPTKLSDGLTAVLHRVSSVGAWTVGLASENPGALGFQQPFGAINTGAMPV